MTDPREALGRAQQTATEARGVLDNPALQRSFARLEAEYLNRIRGSDPSAGRELREAAYLQLQALDALKTDLRAALSGAEITARNNRSALRHD